LPVVEEFAPDFWWRWKNTPADDLPTFLFAFPPIGLTHLLSQKLTTILDRVSFSASNPSCLS